ncbi:MAG: MFS transporter [Coxiellaceae bacterium]|nr:MFS transporter [Coxiellaceae bacterium]
MPTSIHPSMPLIQRNTLFQQLQPWIVVFSASLFFFFEFMQVNMFNAIDASLFKSFHLTDATDLGQLSACYMYANVLFLFPAGMILDRISTRKLILSAMFVCVACAFLFSMTTQLWQAEICRFVTGIGGAFCLLSCVRFASRWFPPKHMALVVGLIVTFAMLGAMLAQTPFTKMTEMFGWRMTLRLDAISGVVMWVIIALFVRDYPKGTKAFFDAQHAELEKIGFWHALKQVIANSQNWLGGAYVSLVNLPVFLLGSTWGGWYLVQSHHLSADDASLVTSILFVGMIIGSPVVGWVSDFLGQRKMPMIVGSVTSLIVIIAIMYTPHLSFNALLGLFFALGFVISFQILGYPLIAESNSALLTGAAEGMASVLIMGGGFLIPVFPMLLNLEWNHKMAHGIPLYSAADYHVAFLIMPIAFLFSLVAAMFVRETHCIAFEEQEDGSVQSALSVEMKAA